MSRAVANVSVCVSCSLTFRIRYAAPPYSTDSEINIYCCCGTCPAQLSMYRDMVHVCIVVSVSQGSAFHIHYAEALHRVNNTN